MTESIWENTKARSRTETVAGSWSGDEPITAQTAPPIAQLITPTWAELDDVRDGYAHDAKRLRRWRWWFIGMFALYTTLVGILLVRLAWGL